MYMKYLIYSLGNPSSQYAYTRHNAGRLLCDSLDFDTIDAEVKISLKHIVGIKDLILEYIVPDVYMNDSGKFIVDDLKYKNIDNKNIIIVYDDIDVPLGEIKLSYDRNSGGHNGVESVIQSLGTKEFYRVRVGIGAKTNKNMLLQDYVLSKLSEDEIDIILNQDIKNTFIQKICEVIRLSN